MPWSAHPCPRNGQRKLVLVPRVNSPVPSPDTCRPPLTPLSNSHHVSKTVNPLRLSSSASQNKSRNNQSIDRATKEWSENGNINNEGFLSTHPTDICSVSRFGIGGRRWSNDGGERQGEGGPRGRRGQAEGCRGRAGRQGDHGVMGRMGQREVGVNILIVLGILLSFW